MVALKNIKQKNNIIEFDYYPENGQDYGHVRYDADKKEVIDKKLAKEDTRHKGIERYLNFAILRLERVLNDPKFDGNFKDRYEAFWY